MNDFFAIVYETIFSLYDSTYNLIFDHLYKEGGYTNFGIIFFLSPLVLYILFYFVLNNPYLKFYHWFFALIVIFLVTAGITWNAANLEIFTSDNQALISALEDPETGYKEYAETLPLKYALINGLLSTLLGFIYSLILKQFSKTKIHLPF